jgi:hypothetical protein
MLGKEKFVQEMMRVNQNLSQNILITVTPAPRSL